MEDPPHPIVYPLRGLKMFCERRELWRCSILPILITCIVSLTSIVLLFYFAYEIQWRLYEDLFPPWLAHLMTVLMIAMELEVILFVLIHILFARYKGQLYEKVFELEGVPKEEHEMAMHEVFLLHLTLQGIAMLLLLISLPINLLPLIGSIAFVLVNGLMLAWDLQEGYMTDKGMKIREQGAFVYAHLSHYAAFGAFAFLLTLVPPFNLIFIFSNLVGAALWSVEQERSGEVDRFLLDRFNTHSMSDFASASLVLGDEPNMT